MLLVGACGRNGTGAAYIYNCSNIWNCTLVTSFFPINGSTGDNFGISTSMSYNLTVIGGTLNNQTGEAYVYNCSNIWNSTTNISSSNQNCTLVTVLTLTNVSSTLNSSLSSSILPTNFTDALFGSRVFVANNTVFIGAVGINNNQGAVFVYNCTLNNCTLDDVIMSPNTTAGAYFGSSIIAVGDLLAVGAGNYNGSLLATYFFNSSNINNCTEVAFMNASNTAIPTNITSTFNITISPDITVVAAAYMPVMGGELYIYYLNTTYGLNVTNSTSNSPSIVRTITSTTTVAPTTSSSSSASSSTITTTITVTSGAPTTSSSTATATATSTVCRM